MASRASIAQSLGIFLALAVAAFAAIYYGAVPWALRHAVDAALWFFGYR